MRCISPLLIRNSTRRDFVPCGKCNFCLQSKRADWSFRLVQEQKRSLTARFLTLTYDDENIRYSDAGFPELRKDDLQLFTKRLRKANGKVSNRQLRYYSVGEYGTVTSRPHYHSIMFNVENSVYRDLDRIWGHGMIHIGDVTEASIHYVTKYVINRVGEFQGREPPFALMSKRPGIGNHYLQTHGQWHRSDMRNYAQVHGQITRLPRYFKDRIFTSAERSRMAVEALSDADIAYWDEVERLSAFHCDPVMYYDESMYASHDAVKSKVNSLNKF